MNDNDRAVRPLKLKGRFDVIIRDRDGRIKHKGRLTAHNGIVNVGKDKLLGVMFNAATQITAWFMGLINDSPSPTLGAIDTMLVHAGWVESSTDYSEATRPAWPEDAPASQKITNTTEVVFSITATVTIAGFFLVDNSTKGGTAGTLWCTALFDGGPQAVVSGDTIKVTYTLST